MNGDEMRHRLGPMDAFFLYSEREESPMHVGCLAVFEGKIPFKRFVQNLESKLHFIPRYRQRVMHTPFNIGHPTWEYDPEFNIHNHVTKMSLPAPGTFEQLRELSGTLMEGILDRDKPLWETHIIYGLEEGRTAMFVKIHHAMVDGIAGIGLLMVLFDMSREPFKTRKEPYLPPDLPDPATQIYSALWDNAIDGLEHWSNFQKSLLDYGKKISSSRLKESVGDFGEVVAKLLRPIERLPFNKPFTGKRAIAYSRFSFAEARAIRSACNATVNDVMLSVLAGAVRRYLEHHGESPRKRVLRILVPVNIRTEDETDDMGNRITFLPVEIDLGVKDPVERLRQVTETTALLKEERVADGVNLLFNLLQGTAPPVQAFSLGTVSRPAIQSLLGRLFAIPPMNLICTNVPGPQIPLYCVGHKMIDYFPLLPVALEMGISCGITSYNQRLYCSLIADANAAPDVDTLKSFLDESFVELRVRASVEEMLPIEIGHVIRDTKVQENVPSPNGKKKSASSRVKRAPKKKAVARHASKAKITLEKSAPRKRKSAARKKADGDSVSSESQNQN